MIVVLTLGVFHAAAFASAQQEHPQASSSPFTHEQMAVYKAFFADYLQKGSQQALNVGEITEILHPDDGDYSGCMKGFPKSPPASVIHRLTEDFGQQNHLRIKGGNWEAAEVAFRRALVLADSATARTNSSSKGRPD